MKLKRKEQLNSMRRNIDMLKIEIETGGAAIEMKMVSLTEVHMS